MSCDIRNECPLKNVVRRLPLWAVAVVIRLLASFFVGDFCSQRPELIVPHNSFQRLSDGIYMRRNGLAPYDGDMLHCQPILLDLFALIVDCPRLLLAMFIVLDIVIAELLGVISSIYLRERSIVDQESMQKVPDLVIKCYLLNPVAIAACVAFSLSVVYNFLAALFLLCFVKGFLVLSCVLYASLVHLTLYPVIFIFALFVKFPSAKQRALLIVVSISSFVALLGLNYLSEGNFGFLDSTYMFLLDVSDLTPNVGIFWYFFIEVFSHFRLFFTWVFQVNVLVYLVPLTLALRSNSFLLVHLLLILVSVFSSYPSMAECLVYLSLFPVFVNLRKHIRWGLVIACTLATCVVLTPITWNIWIVNGSGNANFYFAVTLSYSVAQIFLLTDLLYAHLREGVARERGEIVDNDIAMFVLK